MITPREKYERALGLFQEIDKIIQEEKPKDTKLRDSIWQIWAQLNS